MDTVIPVDFRDRERVGDVAAFWRDLSEETENATLSGVMEGDEHQGRSASERELFDAKLQASESRTDAKFAEMRTELTSFRGELVAAIADLKVGIMQNASATERSIDGVMQAVTSSRGELEGKIENLQTTLDGKINTSQAAIDGRIGSVEATLSGRISTVDATIASKASPRDIWLAALAVFGAVLAALAFGGDRLSVGLGLADQRQDQMQLDAAQNNMAVSIDRKLDRLLAAEKVPLASNAVGD